MASACSEAAGKQRKSQCLSGPPSAPPALFLLSATVLHLQPPPRPQPPTPASPWVSTGAIFLDPTLAPGGLWGLEPAANTGGGGFSWSGELSRDPQAPAQQMILS